MKPLGLPLCLAAAVGAVALLGPAAVVVIPAKVGLAAVGTAVGTGMGYMAGKQKGNQENVNNDDATIPATKTDDVNTKSPVPAAHTNVVDTKSSVPSAQTNDVNATSSLVVAETDDVDVDTCSIASSDVDVEDADYANEMARLVSSVDISDVTGQVSSHDNVFTNKDVGHCDKQSGDASSSLKPRSTSDVTTAPDPPGSDGRGAVLAGIKSVRSSILGTYVYEPCHDRHL